MPTTVILGAGIIGLSTAHSLTLLAPPEHRIHLVEPAPELFSSASGKAAGFVAKDWFAPAIAPLGNLSFDLHRALADKHNGRARWGFSESISYSLDHDDALSATSADDPIHISDTSAGGEGGEPERASIDGQSVDEQIPVSGRNGSQGKGGLDWLLNNVSRATVVEGDVVEKAQSEGASAHDGDDLPHWLRARPEALQVISDRKSTAQVLPRRLCEFLLEQCLAAGVTLHQPARATKVWRDEDDPAAVTRIRVEYLGPLARTSDGRARTVDIPCDSIVIAAGCWTPQVYTTLFPNANRIPRITHLAGYSVTFKSRHWPPVRLPANREALRAPKQHSVASSGPDAATATTSNSVLQSSVCHAIFTNAGGFAPEIFSRANGDVWLGGLNPVSTQLPELPTDATLDPSEIDRLLAVGRALCGEDIDLRTEGLCFRPVSVTGRPIITRLHEADLGDGAKPGGHDGAGGVYVATGHGPWGISLSLGTGRVVSEMVLGRETSADVSALMKW
ncbi:nucleotide-binding domain-containing protein [Cubamyces lactineus]|nr:nucleotide-binding domain-containing protein [Cubamyces lactineus]